MLHRNSSYKLGGVSTAMFPFDPPSASSFSELTDGRVVKHTHREKKERKLCIFSGLCEMFQFRRHEKAKWLIYLGLMQANHLGLLLVFHFLILYVHSYE